MTTLRFLIVAQDPLIRAGLSALLAEQETLELVGQTADPAEIGVYRPDVVLWDTGYELDKGLLDELIELDHPIVALVDDAGIVGELTDAGVLGCLSRSAEPDQIAAAAQAALLGLAVLDHLFLDQIATPERPSPSPGVSEIEQLTERESEILQLMADGMTNKGIAAELIISPNTVKFHITSILSKLNAQSRTEAVSIASRSGLLIV